MWEVAFELLNRGDLIELANQLHKLHVKSETEELVIYTTEDDLRSLDQSFLFRQLIFGHEHKNDVKTSGNAYIIASGLFTLDVLIFTLLGKIVINKRSNWKSNVNGIFTYIVLFTLFN